MKRRRILWAVMAVCAVSGCNCRRPYDVPEYIEIGAHETGFLVPLEGDTAKQAKFDSAAAVSELRVAAKRVQVTHRWNQEGRWKNTGKWISTVRLIKVNRAPVTRQWTAETKTGTTAKDEGIWAESKDSVGFSTGFSVTAMVTEEDAALFLYRYQSCPLSKVMDSEVRARIQAVFAECAAEYNLSELRERKVEIIAAIRGDLIPFFAERGISLTTIAMFGGLAYENPAIQKSIDAVFISQREKEVSKAMLEAQMDKNRRIEMEALALANKEREIARGVADGKRAILAVAKEAADDPVFLKLRQFEVQEAHIAKWNGSYPGYLFTTNGGGGPGLLLNMPTENGK